MTCIVGLKHGGKVTLGGDSAGVAGLRMMVRADEKVFVRDDAHGEKWGFAYTSSFRMGQLLRFTLSLPQARPVGDRLFEFMATTFIDAVRACFKSGGFLEKEKEAEQGGHFLVAFRGELFLVEGDFQVGRPLDTFAAHGCGIDVALGALYALTLPRFSVVDGKSVLSSQGAELELDADQVVRSALHAAERFSAGVRGPFYTVTV